MSAKKSKPKAKPPQTESEIFQATVDWIANYQKPKATQGTRSRHNLNKHQRPKLA